MKRFAWVLVALGFLPFRAEAAAPLLYDHWTNYKAIRDSLHVSADPDTNSVTKLVTLAASASDTTDLVKSGLGMGTDWGIVCTSGSGYVIARFDSTTGRQDSIPLSATGVAGFESKSRWVARLRIVAGSGGGTFFRYLYGMKNR